jgi:GntR family transcriptional regulator
MKDNLDIYINKNIEIPLHLQLTNEIKKLIKERKINFNELTEGYLEKELNLSRNTVRQAISKLVEEGWVIRQRSKGIKIVENSASLIEESTHGLSFTEVAIKMGKKSRVKGIISKIITTPEFLIKLIPNINKDDKIFYTKRLRYLDENPVCIVQHYLPIKFAPGISEEDFSEEGPLQSFHYILERRYRLNILKWKESISVSEASVDDSKLLKIPEGSSLLLRKDLTFSTEGRIIYYSIHKFISNYKITGIIIFKERL